MKIYKTLTLLIIVLFTACNSDDDTIENQDNYNIESDRNALIEIYNANAGNSLGWDISTTDVSTWNDVTVENDRVTVLHIGNRGLSVFPTTAMQKLTALSYFSASGNSIQSIDISNNTNLKNLALFNNYITSINLSNNILLEQVLLENNLLENLDVSMLPNLIDLKGGSNNFINSVNIANGNNSNMWRMQLSSNNLSCVQVDSGATNGFNGWSISTNASYSVNCQ